MSRAFVWPVKPVHQPVYNRRDKNPENGNKHKSAQECVQTGEHFPLRRERVVYGTHSAEQHGRVEEGVAPAQVLVMPVSPHSDR